MAAVLMENGAAEVLGIEPGNSGVLPGVDSARRMADRKGILAADVVVVFSPRGRGTGQRRWLRRERRSSRLT